MKATWIVWPLVCAAAAAADLSAAESTAVSGRVYLDANGNGRLDAGEKGLAGVRVTDGVGFVTSRADGTYRIAIGDDPTFPQRSSRTVGVCWPSNFWPSGPWWARLSRVGDATAVDFGLRAEVQNLPFVYLHMTDPHEHFNDAHREFAEFVNDMPADVKFIIDTGDSFRPKTAERPFKRLFFSTVGNHDTWELPDPPPEGRFAAWTDRLGPLRWSFDHAGVHFIGADVIDGNKTKPMVDWLEGDLAAVPVDTRIVLSYHYPDLSGDERFTRILRQRRVEVVHAGHDHAYGWTPGKPALVTAYHWQPPGTCNVAVVSNGAVDVGVYCLGCKKSPGRHSRRCPIAAAEHILLAAVKPRFSTLHNIAPGPLADVRTVKLDEPHAYIQARFTPAAARVRLELANGAQPLEIAYARDRFIVAGTSVPLPLRAGRTTLDLTVFAHRHLLTVWANNEFFIEKPVVLERVGDVRIAADGPAVIESMTIQEVKTDPRNAKTSYACGCGHGSLRRVP